MNFFRRIVMSILVLSGIGFGLGCGQKDQENEGQSLQGVEVFEPIVGIDFYEVRRTFDTGVSYDSLGFVQLPEWHLRFAKKDSILIYSPYEDRMVGYKVHHDHDTYFHFARDSWRVHSLSPDSIIIQRLSLNGLKVNKIKSNVYMKFYSERYLMEEVDKQLNQDSIARADGQRDRAAVTLEKAETLEQKVARLRLPTAADTAFVKSQVELANRNPGNMDSTFASRNFAQVKSKHPVVTVTKRKIQHLELTEKSPAYEYLYPEYYIKIDRAYKDFNHDFSVIIDEHGKMRLGKVYVMEDFVEARTRVVEGIIDVYLSNWLEVTPAQTLGMPHASTVYLYVKGRLDD
jgi:hypothetical protein